MQEFESANYLMQADLAPLGIISQSNGEMLADDASQVDTAVQAWAITHTNYLKF